MAVLVVVAALMGVLGGCSAPARNLGPPRGQLTIDGGHGWFGPYNGIVFVTLAALPVAVLTVWALARRRCLTGCTPARAWRMSIAEVGIVYGTVPWVALTMVPGDRAGAVPSQLSLVPLRDLLTMPAYQIVGNLLIFAALGFLAPVRFAVLASLGWMLALRRPGLCSSRPCSTSCHWPGWLLLTTSC